jgi:hypothetical protein
MISLAGAAAGGGLAGGGLAGANPLGTAGASGPLPRPTTLSFVDASTFIGAGRSWATDSFAVDPGSMPSGGAGFNPAAGVGSEAAADVPAAFGSSAFSACAGSPTASTRCRAVLAPSLPVVNCLTTKTAPSTTAAIATSSRRPRGRARTLVMEPGGTDTELGFCAGVSSLADWRRTPPGGVALRGRLPALEALELGGGPALDANADPDAPLARPVSTTSVDGGFGRLPTATEPEGGWAIGAGGAAEFRATTSAGDSNPVWVTVREGAIVEEFGREGVFPRPFREGGRGAELGVRRGPALLALVASPTGARLGRSRPGFSCAGVGESLAPAVVAASAPAVGSDPECAPTV